MATIIDPNVETDAENGDDSVIPAAFFERWRDAHFRPARSFGYWVDDQKESIVGMARDHYALLIVLSGNVSIHFGDQACELAAHDMVLLKPAQQGYKQVTHRMGAEVLRMPIEWSPGVAGAGHPLEVLPLMSVVRHSRPDRLLEVGKMLSTWDPSGFSFERRLAGQAILIEILTEYIVTGFRSGTLQQEAIAGDDWLAQATRHIAATFRDPKLNLGTLVELTGRSPRRLQQAFQARHNLSPVSYIHQQRILHAIRLLQANPHMKIDYLMTRIGYRNRSLFNRMFKKYTGTTPSSYRPA